MRLQKERKRVRKMSTDEQPTSTIRQSRRLAEVAPEYGLLDTRRLTRQSSTPEPVQLDDHVDLPTSSPERKREAEGSPHVSPSTNSPDSRSPPKKPALAPGADLAPEPLSPHARIGIDGWDSLDKTPVSLLEPSSATGNTPMVQGAPGSMVPRTLTPTWDDPGVPRNVVVTMISVAGGGARDSHNAYAEFTRDIIKKQELEALRFFQKAHEDRSRLLDDRETRLVEMAESAAQAAEAHETYRQEQFKEALGYLQECYQRELDLARCVVGNEANETLSQEIEKQQAMWEARMLRFQENLELLTWNKERSSLLQDKEVSLLALKNQHSDELLRVSTEAEHTIEVRRLEDGGILNQLQEELRSAKHNHTYEIQALVEKTRRSREAQETILDELRSQQNQELISLRTELRSKQLELDATQYSSARGPSERICANCPILEREKDILTERLRLLEEQLRETDRQRERFEQLWGKGRRQLQESEQRTLVSNEALNEAQARFQESETRGSQLQEQLLQVHTRYEQELQEEQTLREEMERGVQEQLLALRLDRDSEERRVVTQEREDLMKSREEHEAILQKVSEAQTQLGLNTTLLREEEKTFLREREAFAQEVNKSYSNLRREQSSFQVDQQTLALQLQEGRLRSGSVGTPYATPASSRKGSPSKGSLSTFMTSSVLHAPYSMTGTPQRTMDPIPVFMQQTEVATETMSMPVPAGVYGRTVTSQKPFMPERPRQREPPEYIPQDSYGIRGHSNPSPPYFTPAHGDRGGVFGGGSSNPPGPPSSYPAPGGPGGRNPFERSGGRGDPPGPPGGGGPGNGGDDHGGGGAPRFPYVPQHDDHGDRPSRSAYADARKYAPKLKRVDSAIPLEHFLKKFDALQMDYGITDEQEFIMKTMTERMATITADSYRRTGETVNKYACRIGDNIRNANFPPESAVFILLNECEDPIVASCLRGGPTLPTAIEASLKYLKEKDVNLEKPFEGNPKTAMISLGTPGRAPRGLAKAPATPTNEVQELQATVSKMKREMTAMAAKQNARQQEQISAFHNVVAQMAHEQTPGANNPVQPKISNSPDDETKNGEVICGRCSTKGHGRDRCPRLNRHQAAGSGVASKVTPKMTPDTDKNKLTLTTTVGSSPGNSKPRVTPTATTKTMMPPLHGTSAAPRAIEGSYEDPDERASETRLQDQECLMTRGDPNSVDDMTTTTGRDESPTNDDDQALGIRRIEYLTDKAHNTPGLPLDATLQTSITQQPNETYTNTESARLQAVDPASLKDTTVPSPFTNAKADTRPPGLKAAVRSRKTATSQATTTATTPGIQSFKNRGSKKLRPPATPGPRLATSGAPTKLATTPGYETGPSPRVTPVFTEAQIEAIMRGDLTGIPESRHVDIEERLYPVSPADLERQLVRLKQERKDVTQEDIVKVVTMALRRPLTRDDAHLFESPSNIDDPDRWLDWFSSTLKTCDEARTANRNFENARVAIISDTRWSRFQRKNLASNELPGFGPIPETDCTPPEGDVLPIGGTKIPRLPAQQLVKVHGTIQYHLTDDRASFTLPLRDLELTRLPSAIWRIRRRTLSSRRHYLDLALGGHHIESNPAPLTAGRKTRSLSPRGLLTQTIPSRPRRSNCRSWA
ncbi:hypothetical protein DYB26_005186 [Aphanomyces astaci]|uniref:Uncharacterized protein n=1 Tax=Aphanomyces astaci TaxID=112090 RepID=A0A3R7CAF2_APHAT|nr:hypothetical protein DYB26_005186 [Aphanomyces astaci]